MKVIRMNKIRIQSIEIYQTGFIAGIENWVSPHVLLKEIKNENPDYDIKNCRIHIHMDSEDNIIQELEVSNVDGIQLF